MYGSFLEPEGVTPSNIYVRTSTEDRTYQVAGGMLFGMDPKTQNVQWQVHVQPSTVSSSFFTAACISEKLRE